MKKLFLICLALLVLVTTASARSVAKDKSAKNDTLFMMIYDNDTVYVTDNDITTRHNGAYYLTEEKYRQLDKIYVVMGHFVRFFEKSPSGLWTSIRVQHTWDNYLPSGVRMLWLHLCDESSTTADAEPCAKIVAKEGVSGYFVIMNES